MPRASRIDVNGGSLTRGQLERYIRRRSPRGALCPRGVRVRGENHQMRLSPRGDCFEMVSLTNTELSVLYKQIRGSR